MKLPILSSVSVIFSLSLLLLAADASGTDTLSNAPAFGKVTIRNGKTHEHIHFRKVGYGKHLLVLIPGNNTSGAVYNAFLNQFRAQHRLQKEFTALAFDYRGSGNSSYNQAITSLADFAHDFHKALNSFDDIHSYKRSIVAYSMGFAVAMELVNIAPKDYHSLIGLAPVGTRGNRVTFSEKTAGKDNNGKIWRAGDWVPVHDDTQEFSATRFQQRFWQGQQRTFQNIKNTWDALVFNDALKYNLLEGKAELIDLHTSPAYLNALEDCLSIQYMPASLFFTHTFNISGADLPSKINSDGSQQRIPTRNKMAAFKGKNILLVKAQSDGQKWRGDMVIDDHSFFQTAQDLAKAQATVQTVLINAGQGYDHGLTITHPSELSELIHQYLTEKLDQPRIENVLAAKVQLHRYWLNAPAASPNTAAPR